MLGHPARQVPARYRVAARKVQRQTRSPQALDWRVNQGVRIEAQMVVVPRPYPLHGQHLHSRKGWMPKRHILIPIQRHTSRQQSLLVLTAQSRAAAHIRWSPLLAQAKSSQRTGGLADIPLHRMQTVATIGDVRGADVLAGRQQVVQVPRHERTPTGSGRAWWARCTPRQWLGRGCRWRTSPRRRCR